MKSIDNLYEGVIAKLTDQEKIKSISLKLLSLKTNDERVLYVYDILKDLKVLPKSHTVSKSEFVSTYYRNHGNQCFQKSEDYRAWQYYNLSLAHAPLQSENYSLALANRSAVFYSQKKYTESLEDINKVFSLNYPKKLKDKLCKRKLECEKLLRQNNDDNDDATSTLFNIQGPRLSQYPCASDKLEVINTEDMGRHVVAKEDIKVGEVLVQEEPYFLLLLKSQYLFNCSYCISMKGNLMPCSSCCFALYCSQECQDKALKEYHNVECLLMPTLVGMDFTKLELLALRTVIKAYTDHADWNALYKTIEDAEATINTKHHGLVKVNDEWVYDSKYYASIHTLASNIDKRSISDIFQKSVTAAVFLHLLLENTDFLKAENGEESDKVRKCVAGMLLLHIMTSPTNMHGIGSNVQTKNGNFVDEISLASAPYAFHSLLNHSCAPNVVRFVKLGTGLMTLFALRPIKKGMQLFDNYGSHHALQDRHTRQKHLRFQYKFVCLCEACVNDWPTYFTLQHNRNIPLKISKQIETLLGSDSIEKLQKGCACVAMNIHKPLCELVENLDPYAPCVEHSDCQEALKQCLTIIFKGLVPYGYSQTVEWNAVPPKL